MLAQRSALPKAVAVPSGPRPLWRLSKPVASKPAVSARSKQCSYSITSSARNKIEGGTVRPSTLAVLTFTAISYFTGI
jgi:hypothetical protein